MTPGSYPGSATAEGTGQGVGVNLLLPWVRLPDRNRGELTLAGFLPVAPGLLHVSVGDLLKPPHTPTGSAHARMYMWTYNTRTERHTHRLLGVA